MAARMNRRDMLKLFTSGVLGALVLDPERLLWVREKTIFIMPPVAQGFQREALYLWQLAIRVSDVDGTFHISKEWQRMETAGGKVFFGSNTP